MSAFIIKRLLWGIPTLLVILLLCFLLLDHSPGKAVDTYMSNNFEGVKSMENIEEYEYYYIQSVKKLGLDKPAFYFTLTNRAMLDTIGRITFLPKKAQAEKLSATSGNKKAVGEYFHTIDYLLNQVRRLTDTVFVQKNELTRELYNAKKDAAYSDNLEKISQTIDDKNIASQLENLLEQQKYFARTKPSASLLIPAIKWNGTDNRFHLMLTRLFSGEKNISLIDSRPVWLKIRESLRFTLAINLLAFILSVFVSYKLAIWLSMNAGRRVARSVNSLMFVLYTMPAFWVGSMLLMFFSSSTYGSMLNWFPPGGVGDIGQGDNFFEIVGIRLHHYLLPVICISYPVIVFLTTHLKDSIKDASGNQWAVTARAKGLSEVSTIKRHVLRNAIFPYITLLGNIIPSIFAGSVIMEVLFNIPGMGRLAYQSIISRDWPVLFNIILISGIITVLAQILTDILYAWLDPRINTGK